MRFELLFNSFNWKQIKGCPGRYVLEMPGTRLSPSEILGGTHPVTVHSATTARDQVFVARVENGGLISYRRPDGTFVHTLNTAEGFARKIAQLGLTSPSAEEPAQPDKEASAGGHSE